jgi:formylglycine-generating enzyme required for sulfatase activity
LLVLLSPIVTLHADIGYQFVTVGNPGNANDPATGNLYGGVSYVYDMGTYDVTLNQYAAFLNAVARSDPYRLYDTNSATDLHVAGILRSGASGSYSYSVIGDGQRPVTYVTWLDAARFANWMHNGQPAGLGEVAGSTEQGAYPLNGDTGSPFGGTESKNSNALYWIPTESEWYKAAFYDLNLNSGAGGYWAYATRSNAAPGNVMGSLPNQANYYTGVFSVTQSSSYVYGGSQNYLTRVGAFTNSASPWGTYDQNGNVYQWNDALISSERGVRGGDWFDFYGNTGTYRDAAVPTTADNQLGFRLARISAKVTGIARLGNGTVVLQCRGFPSQSHTVKFSPDLITPFAPLGAATAASDGTFQFTDGNAGNLSRGFYQTTFP